ncbi:MAG: translocation/assembly module TamB domain-containing protein [Fusobacteriaceae bacterium]
MKKVITGIRNIIRDSRVKTLLSLFFLFIGIGVAALMNLGYTVALILSLALKPTFHIGEMEFLEWGKISGKNIELIYENQKIVVAPKVYVEYEIKGSFKDWLKKIEVENPEILIEIKDSDINIVNAFATGGTAKSGTGVPLRFVEVKGGNLTFKDFSYEIPIEKKLENVEGYVSFDRIKGIDLLFSGENENEKASYSFNNNIEQYEMNIKLKNMEIDTSLLQYGYYYEPVQYKSGKVDLDLTISPRGLEGVANLREAEIEYSDFLQPAEKVNGKVDFLGKKIVIKADFEIFSQKKKFDLEFDFEKGMDAKIDLGKMTLSQLENYRLLKNISLKKIPMDVENLAVILKLDSEKKFSLNVDYVFSDLDFSQFQLKNARGGLIYSEQGVEFNFLKAEGFLNGKKKNIEISGDLKNEKMEMKYSLDDFLGEVDLFFSEGYLRFVSKKGILKGEGLFDYESKILSMIDEESQTAEIPDPIIIYDIKNTNLQLFQGEWSLELFGIASLKLIGTGENNEIYFNQIQMLQADKIVLAGEGELDLNKGYYRFSYESENLQYNHSLAGDVLEFELNSIGELSGNGKEFRFDSEGTIERLTYGKYAINGLRYSFKVDQENLQILNISNNILTINGNYNIIQKELSLDYEIKNLGNEYLKIDDIKFNVVEGKGKFTKNDEGIYADLNLIDSKIYIFEENFIGIYGKISYDNGLINWKDITLNKNSKISGQYNLENLQYFITANIFETNLSQYIQDKNFKYRLIGQFSAEGIGKSVDAKGLFTVDDLFFKGERVGKLKGNLTYKGEDFSKGILDIGKIDFIRYREPVFGITGRVDLESEMINLTLDEKNISIESVYKDSPFEGDFSLKSHIQGSFNEPKFSFQLNSRKVIIEDFKFYNIDIGINGDFEKVYIDNLSFNYLENKMEVKGYYDIKNSQYLMKLDSKEINLDFLNLLAKKLPVKEIGGGAVIDLTLSNRENSGSFKGEGITFSLDESRIKGEDINFDLSLTGKKIEIKNFLGKINNGTAEIGGYFNVPSLLEINQNSEFYKKLDYNLSLKLKEVNYDLEKELRILLNSELKFSENKLSGKIDFVEGDVKGIPGIGKGISIIGILKKIILVAIPVRFGEKESIDEEYEKEITETETMGIDLDFKIIKGINVDIPNIWNILEEIKGKITGGGKLSGQLNKLSFIGQIEVNKGEFILGENDFKISTGRLVLNKPEDYIPNLNPILSFEAKSPVGNTEISLAGEMKSLNFRIKNNNQSSSGTLASLFNSESSYSEENNRLGPSATIIKNLLGAQITNSFLSPASRALKKIFGLTKLRITADITDAFSDVESEGDKNDQTNFNFGIKIIAEDKIYKDKLFAVADARITGASDEENKRSRYSGYNNFDRYSAGLEYRYTEGQSFGIGVQNEGEDGYGSENQKIKKEKLNYYIDFKIEKKYDSLIEIYTGIIKKILPKE